jgi:hypothetical protein
VVNGVTASVFEKLPRGSLLMSLYVSNYHNLRVEYGMAVEAAMPVKTNNIGC